MNTYGELFWDRITFTLLQIRQSNWLQEVSSSVTPSYFKIFSSCGFFFCLWYMTWGTNFANSVHLPEKDVYFGFLLPSWRKLHITLSCSTIFFPYQVVSVAEPFVKWHMCKGEVWEETLQGSECEVVAKMLVVIHMAQNVFVYMTVILSLTKYSFRTIFLCGSTGLLNYE